MRLSSIVPAAAVALALAIGANAVAADAVAQDRPEVRVHVLDGAKVLVPSSLAPGLAHLRNDSTDWLLVVKGKKHSSAASLVKYLNNNGPTASKKFDVVDELMGSKDTYLRLTKGNYYFVDIFADHIRKANVGVVHVTGRTVNAKAPKSRSVTVDKHNHLHSPAFAPNHTWLRFRNFDGHTQSLLLWKVGSDTSAKDVAAFLADPSEQTADDLDIVDFASAGLLPAHHDAYYHLGAKGRYLLVTIAATKQAPGSLFVKNRVRLITVR